MNRTCIILIICTTALPHRSGSFKAKEAIVLVAIEFRRKACKRRWQPDEVMKVNAGAVRIFLLKVAQRRAVKTFLFFLLKVPPPSKHPPPVCKIFTHTRQVKVILKQELISGYTRLDFLWQCLFSIFTKRKNHCKDLAVHLNALECVYFLAVYLPES